MSRPTKSPLERPQRRFRRATSAAAGTVFALGTILLFERPGPALSQRAPNDGLVVEGLRGQIPREAVSRVIATRMNDLVACVSARADANDMLSGSVTLGLAIAPAGTVRIARIVASDLGDRTAERCMTTIVASLRFPAPTGGEADASETFRFPLDEEVRAPLAWTADRVRSAAGTSLARLATRCRISSGSVRVTAYVGRGGHVLGAGAHASSPELDATIDCVLTAVTALDMPDPGSYPAKVTFDVGAP